jgi:hypothetical protein
MFPRFVFLLSLVLVPVGHLVTAQTAERAGNAAPVGSIHGTVRDNRGEIVPGTMLTLVSQNEKRTAISQADGTFRFLAVAPGPYLLTADSLGLETLHTLFLTIKAGESSHANMTMVVQEGSPEIRVSKTPAP